MASFSSTCPKPSALLGSLHSNSTHKQPIRQASISFRSESKLQTSFAAGSSQDRSVSYGFQSSSRKKYNLLMPCATIKDVDPAVTETKSEESIKETTQNIIPEPASISAFMSQVADLITLVDSRDITELQLKQDDCEIRIRKKEAFAQPPPAAASYAMMQSPSPPQYAPAPAPAAPVPTPASVAPSAPKSSHPPLKCPMAGTFYRCPSPGSPPFVKVGDKVQKGQVLCIIEAMKLMNDIEADQSGTVVEILVDDGKPVSVDMPLFIIEP